jgi:hypothetical protein
MGRLGPWPILLLLNAGAAKATAPPRAVGLRAHLAGVSVPFIVNDGQLDLAVAFYAPTFAGTIYVTRDGRIVHSLSGGENHGWSLTETAIGGTARPKGERQAETHVSYFIGNDPARWRRGIGTYESVSLGEIWPGVSVSLKAQGKNVEKLFTVRPGADPVRIRMSVGGAQSLRVGTSGALIASTALGDVVFTRPAAYQETDGARRAVVVSYRLRGCEYGFRLGDHDPALPVVIDPLLQATYLGGGSFDEALALTVHPTSGEIFVAGRTNSTNFPGTAGGAQTSGGGFDRDAFLARLDAGLTTLAQATYVGGSGSDEAFALAIHPTSGEVFVAGRTDSKDFPGTAGGAQPAIGGTSYDAFVARLNATLTTLGQSTYLGGSSFDELFALAIYPASGEVFVAGWTDSTNFPGTAGGAQPTNGGFADAFVARLNAALTTLGQATYLGGSFVERANALAINPTSGEAFVAGLTNSTDFPATAGGAQPAIGGVPAGLPDAFVARLNAALTTLAQATYLGGTFSDIPLALAVSPTSSEVFVAGWTDSANFPATTGGAQPAYSGVTDAFVARLNAALTTLAQATYLGGSISDLALSLAIYPASGEVFVAGWTDSTNFPGTAGGAQPTNGGFADAFVARLNAALTTLAQATYLGGSNNFDVAWALTIHPTSRDVFVAGQTNSTDFPGTAGGAQPLFGGGGSDAFVARMTADLGGPAGGPTPTPTPANPTPTLTPTGPTPTLTPTPVIVPGDPNCGQFGAMSCPSSSRGAQLTTADCPLGDGSYYDAFQFQGFAGQLVTIDMTSAFDTYLFLLDPAMLVAAADDDSGGGTNSRIVFTLNATGTWTIVANSFAANQFGPYALTLGCVGGPTPTPTPTPVVPSNIPTLSFTAMVSLAVGLLLTAWALIRRG